MNSLERILSTIAFRPADRVPVIPQVFGGAAALAGVPLDQYVRDGELLAACQLSALRHYRYDAVFTVMDVNVENEAIGSVLDYRPNRYPTVARHALAEDEDWSAWKPPEPLKAGRMPEMLKALGILRSELGEEVLIVGCVTGPWTLTTQLLGMEHALYLAIDDCARLECLMDFATDTIVHFGIAQLHAGAHIPLVFDPSASPDVVPPQFFRELELPRLRRILHAFAEAGASASWLHIAGPAQSILSYYEPAGVRIANFDYCVVPEEAQRSLPNICLAGNIRPIAFVDSTPDDIKAQSRDLLAAFRDRGGFILSSGCEIPPESAPETIAALVSAACEEE